MSLDKVSGVSIGQLSTSFQLSCRKISWLSKMLPSDYMVTKWYGIFSNMQKTSGSNQNNELVYHFYT